MSTHSCYSSSFEQLSIYPNAHSYPHFPLPTDLHHQICTFRFQLSEAFQRIRCLLLPLSHPPFVLLQWVLPRYWIDAPCYRLDYHRHFRICYRCQFVSVCRKVFQVPIEACETKKGKKTDGWEGGIVETNRYNENRRCLRWWGASGSEVTKRIGLSNHSKTFT